MLNGDFGNQAGIAVLLKQRGYLLDDVGRRAAEARPGREPRGVRRSLPRALRLAAAGLALVLRGIGRG